MSNIIVQPPTKEVLALCDDADAVIQKYLAGRRTVRGKLGRFEAEVEAYTIMNLLIRHLESISQLARHDLAQLPSAIVLARAIFEATVRTRWMLRPVDPFEREVRWVLHLRSAIDQSSKLENAWKKIATEEAVATATAYRERRKQHEEFDAAISKLLSDRGYSLPKQAPNIWEMIKDIGEPNAYIFYIRLSAYTHTNFEAGYLYRKNLGNAKKLGEFITPADWLFPLEVAWRSFFVTAHDFLYWVEADMAKFSGQTLLKNFELHLSELYTAR